MRADYYVVIGNPKIIISQRLGWDLGIYVDEEFLLNITTLFLRQIN